MNSFRPKRGSSWGAMCGDVEKVERSLREMIRNEEKSKKVLGHIWCGYCKRVVVTAEYKDFGGERE